MIIFFLFPLSLSLSSHRPSLRVHILRSSPMGPLSIPLSFFFILWRRRIRAWRMRRNIFCNAWGDLVHVRTHVDTSRDRVCAYLRSIDDSRCQWIVRFKFHLKYNAWNPRITFMCCRWFFNPNNVYLISRWF